MSKKYELIQAIRADEKRLDCLLMEAEAIQLQMDLTARNLEEKRFELARLQTDYIPPIVPLKMSFAD